MVSQEKTQQSPGDVAGFQGGYTVTLVLMLLDQPFPHPSPDFLLGAVEGDRLGASGRRQT